jgi:hypothetical protein
MKKKEKMRKREGKDKEKMGKNQKNIFKYN